MSETSFDTSLRVSTIVGRWQILVLTWATRVIFVAALIGLILPSIVGTALRIGVVGVAIAQVANIVTSAGSRGGAPYVAGILVLLAISGIQFVALALGSISRRP